MKLRIGLIALAVLLLGNTASAETDIFGGYSLLNLDFDSGDRETLHGWDFNVAGDVANGLGIVGDASGFYEDGASIHTYMGGVRFSVDAASVTPFAQAMVGGAKVAAGTDSESGLAMGFGGGVDVPVADQISVRAVQFDWIPVRIVGEWFNSNVRLAFGIVFNIN
jgi:hypothetical protein